MLSRIQSVDQVKSVIIKCFITVTFFLFLKKSHVLAFARLPTSLIPKSYIKSNISMSLRFANSHVSASPFPRIPHPCIPESSHPTSSCARPPFSDSLRMGFYTESLRLINFGDSIKKLISTFYSNSKACVRNNGLHKQLQIL